jgi:hypothetical protein
MRFAIYATVSCHDNRDGFNGSATYRWSNNSYETLACARKIAERDAADERANWSEVVLSVRLANGKPLPHKHILAEEPSNAMFWSPIPF